MKAHTLKIEERYLQRISSGEKTCEIRLNDRDYQTGDKIKFKVLWELTDRPAGVKFEGDYMVYPEIYLITHILHYPEALKDGWVVLSLKQSTI